MSDSQPLTEATEIYRRLEERAINDSNDLNRRVVACRRCRRRGAFLPVVGSGHPLADILLVKYQPHYLEVTEGVAFFGRSGAAILKSLERLGVNPLVVYGTNLLKCHDVRLTEAEKNCPLYWLEEFHLTHPRMMVVMGRQTVQAINKTRVAGMKRLSWDPGAIQTFTSRIVASSTGSRWLKFRAFDFLSPVRLISTVLLPGGTTRLSSL